MPGRTRSCARESPHPDYIFELAVFKGPQKIIFEFKHADGTLQGRQKAGLLPESALGKMERMPRFLLRNRRPATSSLPA